MATPQQIAKIKARWATYAEREKENVNEIRRRMMEAGFTTQEIAALEVADSEGIT